MGDIFEEARKRSDAELRNQQSYEGLVAQILRVAREKIRALNSQIPELHRRLHASRSEPDFDGRGWRLVDSGEAPGWVYARHYGLVLLFNGDVHEYEIIPGQATLERSYDTGPGNPPRFLEYDVLNKILMPTETGVADGWPAPFPRYFEYGGVAHYGFRFIGLLNQVEDALGIARTASVDCRKIPEYVCRVHAWTDEFEQSLIALAVRAVSG
jgi:hypothetical protein